MLDARLKISPPWVTYLNELNALLGNDPEIRIVYDNDEMTVKVFVDNEKKADALYQLLPLGVTFGNVDMLIEVIPSNSEDDEPLETVNRIADKKELLDTAFDRNPVYAYSKAIEGIFSNTLVYAVYKNKVVQFYNDNLNDIHGNISTLYQDIAADVFDEYAVQGVLFCTDIEEKVGMPLGNWP